ncbi:MAG: hypothetical protein BGO07_03370 [Alphaproteobacteria bacterium 40-19]|nr:MAG: hypothetical protein BGO07_03370 [Alphaproteobacteria bacterium 40-19]
MRLAVDVMGADQPASTLLQGVSLFYEKHPSCTFLLCGQQDVLEKELAVDKKLRAVSVISPAPSFVSPTDKPSAALRLRENSSMWVALSSVARGESQGAVSAGNTGAYLALSRVILKTLVGIDRPAIISQLPTDRGESVMLDLGGNLEASAQNLVNFAIMGNLFAQKILKIERPSIGLLNVGSEGGKGTDSLQAACSMLKERESLNFSGFIEGTDIAKGTVDVIVTDGFSGNIALKTGEGIMKMILGNLKSSLQSSFRGRLLGLVLRPVLQNMKDKFDPRRYNGALWLGINGVAVKSHGGTDSVGFAHALQMAYDMVQQNVTQEIEEALSLFL